MKPDIPLILLLSFSCALPSRALRIESQLNPTPIPQPVVDIEDEYRATVAHLYVMPGETMQLDSASQIPLAGAGYYEAMPGEDYTLLVSAKIGFPQLGVESCLCALHVDKIEWNHHGEAITVTGLRAYLETSTGAKIPIVSDVAHPRLAKGKLYFELQGRSGEYWVLTRFGQAVKTGGPWGLWEFVRFFFAVVLPVTLLCLLVFALTGAIRLSRRNSHPDKSFLELMQMTVMRLPLLNKMRKETAIIPSIREE